MSITMQELEHAEKSMQQQWHDLVMAEQQGEPLETLEQMYDTYILLAEEYNRSSEKYQSGRGPAARDSKKRKTFLAREKARSNIKLAS
ncbi:MAG: hypothetical protein NVS3B14_18320 [Ktedonobacteraceae bacterium]